VNQLLLFAVLGLATGALIAGIAVGLVQNYRGSGVTNLALGAVAMVGAYEYYVLRTAGSVWIPLPAVPLAHLGHPWGVVPALVLALVLCALLGAFFDMAIMRRLRAASPLAKLVASLGLLLTLQGIAIQRFGVGGQSAPAVLPASTSTLVHIFGGVVPANQFVLTGIVIVITAGLAGVYRYTRFGLATRAASENETAADLTGLAPQSISAVNTMGAFVLAGALGILVAPTSQLDPTTLPFIVIPALGAALLARFSSFAIAATAGIVMGIIQSELLYLETKSWFPTSGGIPLTGVADLIYFLIIATVLLFQGRGLPTRGALFEARLPAAPSARRIVAPALIATTVCAAALLLLSFSVRGAIINTLIGSLVCMSLVVITGFVGQVSLVQVGLGGIAGLSVARLALNAGIGFPIGAIVAILIATGVGVIVALPAFRVRGVNLAILTVAAMVAIENFVLDNPSWGSGPGGALAVSPPRLFGLDLGPSGGFLGLHYGEPTPTFGLICLVAVLLVGMLVAALRRSLVGQRMLAVRSNERAAAAAGISPRAIKMLAFALSSFIGALAGVLYAYDLASVSPVQFGTTTALEFVAFAYLGGITTVRGALVGALLAPGALVALVMGDLNISSVYLLIIGGVGLIIAIVSAPDGIALTSIRDQPPVALARYLARTFLGRGGGQPPVASPDEASA
jgi:branched-chain amino acid transport system permease protein